MGNFSSFLTCSDYCMRTSIDNQSNKSISPSASISDHSAQKHDFVRLNSISSSIEIKKIDSLSKPMLRRSFSNVQMIDSSPIDDEKVGNLRFSRINHARTNSLTKQSFLFRAKEKLRRNTTVFNLNLQFRESLSDESTSICNSAARNGICISENNYLPMVTGDHDPIDN